MPGVLRVRELAAVYRVRTIPDDECHGRHVKTPRECARLLAAWPIAEDGTALEHSPVERFGVLLLDTKHRIRAAAVLSVGTVDASLVHPREVFAAAMLAGASRVVLFHNHPSGEPSPSPDDRALTDRLMAAGVVMGIPVIDHIVIGHDGNFYSFREHNQC